MRVTYYSRKRQNGKKTYYYRIVDDDGKRSSGVSTGQTSLPAAKTYVEELRKKQESLFGQVREKKALKFKNFAEDWWKWDRCRYVLGKRARGKKISQSYCDIRRGYLENHIMPYLCEKRIASITPDDIEDWLLSLQRKKTRTGTYLSNTSINQILMTLKIMFREGVRKRRLTYDPTFSIESLQEHRKQKGFPTLPEIKMLFTDTAIVGIWDGDINTTA